MTDVLVLRALGLGDLLASVAALRGLRRAWPDGRLVLAAPREVGEWLVALGVADVAVAVRDLPDASRLASRVAPPAVAVNLHGRGPASHEALTDVGAGRLVAYACPEAGHLDGPAWCQDEHEVDRWIRLSQWAGGSAGADDLRLPPPAGRSDHVVVHPGAAAPSRRWPAPRWAAVAAALAARGHRLVVTGSPEEAGLCATVAAAAPGVEDLCGRLDLAGLGRLVGGAALVLSGDTGIAHLATAFGTPSVSLFGPLSPALWGPRVDLDLHRVIWSGDAADPRPGDPHGAVVDPRLASIDVDEVIRASLAALGPHGLAVLGP
ncbi:MAG TPA: glycosyltransferase family 9 protein [Ornithinibacter sp.]|nr:glycosyltransferase family 9 protein [Ornithinibacter sp.]